MHLRQSFSINVVIKKVLVCIFKLLEVIVSNQFNLKN
jgi:hypothetical protein